MELNHVAQVDLRKKEIKFTPGSAKDVGAGATAGSLIGTAIGGPQGAAIGAGVGAAAGYVFGTGNGKGRQNELKW
jgi:outer membrane lipoprotein SlyB